MISLKSILIALSTLGGLTLALAVWMAWFERRYFEWYRRCVGGRWARVRWKTHSGMDAVFEWRPESEVREGEHVVEWEDDLTRTRVRGGEK